MVEVQLIGKVDSMRGSQHYILDKTIDFEAVCSFLEKMVGQLIAKVERMRQFQDNVFDTPEIFSRNTCRLVRRW
jgi:hypothetical protein